MKLTQLIEVLDGYEVSPGLIDFEVRGLTVDSKQVSGDFIFVAIKGANADGHAFIGEAIRRGAKAILTDKQYLINSSREGILFIGVKDTRNALGRLAARFYGYPSRAIKVIGVTGTNGKTTVTYLIESLLKAAGRAPAVLGTINYRFHDTVIPAKNTTPGALDLQSMLHEMRSRGIDYAVMEVSSHALDQDRIEGVNFSAAIFTNLTQDHLDYHKNIESYFSAKAKLFRIIDTGSLAIINNDDEYGRRLKELTVARVLTYGINGPADITARAIKFDIMHTEFTLRAFGKETGIRTRLIGRHNVYNILAAVSYALSDGMDIQAIRSTIAEFNSVPGRLEKIDTGKGFSVFVDYAHTEDALKNVISTLREVSSGRIIVVFGCGGERDKTKRPKMGRVVSKLADYAIVTSDNPRSEDPQDIIRDIKTGIEKDNYCVIADRADAIRKSLALAKSGDIVLLAGKGHENYQVLKNMTVHFDDREAVRECLK